MCSKLGVGAGTEVTAGGLHAAIEFRRTDAQAVAERTGVGLAAQAGHAATIGQGGAFRPGREAE